MCGAIDEEHTQQHNMTSDAASLVEENLNGGGRTEKCVFDVEEAEKRCMSAHAPVAQAVHF